MGPLPHVEPSHVTCRFLLALALVIRYALGASPWNQPMPTLKPRVSITMDADDLAVLDRYAAASGTPRATIVSGLLASAIPELLRASELIELANAAPRHIRQGIVENLSNATSDALGFLEPFNKDYRMIMDSLQAELPLDRGKRREGSAAGAAQRPDAAPPRRRPPAQNPRSLTGGSKT